MCHNFVLVYLSNISFYVLFHVFKQYPFSDVSHKFSLFTVSSVAILVLIVLYQRNIIKHIDHTRNSNNIHFRS